MPGVAGGGSPRDLTLDRMKVVLLPSALMTS